VRYLLDANWIAWYLRGRSEFVQAVDERRSAGLAISIVTLAELLSGVAQSTKRTESESQLREFARGVQILGIDERIARAWGEQDARLSQAGTPIGDLDLFVASTALSHGLIVCTQNRKHFERVQGLKIESVELARRK